MRTACAIPILRLLSIKAEETEYLESVHQYTLSNSGTQKIIINGTTYYFTPQEGDTNIVNLANTGSAAIVEGSSTDYVFTDGTNYWKYDTSQLASSGYSWKSTGANTNIPVTVDGNKYYTNINQTKYDNGSKNLTYTWDNDRVRVHPHNNTSVPLHPMRSSRLRDWAMRDKHRSYRSCSLS